MYKLHVYWFSSEGDAHFLRKLLQSVLLEVVLLGSKMSPVLILRNILKIFHVGSQNGRDC